MRDRMIQFMRGRYGYDELGRVTMWSSLILFVIYALTGVRLLALIAIILLALTDFRLLSRNIARRSEENRIFLKNTAFITRRSARLKQDVKNRRHYHIYRCPNCKQKIRIPKGKGRIEITCPRCHIEFIKKS